MPIATARVRFGSGWLAILGIHAPPPIAECEETNAPTLTSLAEIVSNGRLTRDVGAADILALQAAGVSDANIVRLAELNAFFAYQFRVIAGLRLIRSAGE